MMSKHINCQVLRD